MSNFKSCHFFVRLCFRIDHPRIVLRCWAVSSLVPTAIFCQVLGFVTHDLLRSGGLPTNISHVLSIRACKQGSTFFFSGLGFTDQLSYLGLGCANFLPGTLFSVSELLAAGLEVCPQHLRLSIMCFAKQPRCSVRVCQPVYRLGRRVCILISSCLRVWVLHDLILAVRVCQRASPFIKV